MVKKVKYEVDTIYKNLNGAKYKLNDEVTTPPIGEDKTLKKYLTDE